MVMIAQGNCPKCGKSYSDFGLLMDNETKFHCVSCKSVHYLCPDCVRELGGVCLKCGGRLLTNREYMKNKYGSNIMY